MVTCWRCGVDFDGSNFIEGAPCADCQYEDPPMEWIRLDDVLVSYAERRDRLIKKFHARMYSDREIGEAIGMSTWSVAKWRRRNGLEPHGFSGYEKWKDPEAISKATSERMKGNTIGKGHRVTYTGIKQQRTGLA